jgi:hypothetical protein
MPGSHLVAAIAGGVTVAVDRFALSERAIGETELANGIQAEEVDMVVAHLAAGSCVMWR